MALPTLVVVSGTPGSGKTRLARVLGEAIPCPVVGRDEIKEGMVHAHEGEFVPAPGDALTRRTFTTFFDVVRLLLAAGITVVADAAFQDGLWRQGLEPLSGLAQLRVVRCEVDAAVSWKRAPHQLAPGAKAAHHSGAHLGSLELWQQQVASFEHLSIAAPTIVVDTLDGYSPSLDEVVRFVNAA